MRSRTRFGWLVTLVNMVLLVLLAVSVTFFTLAKSHALVQTPQLTDSESAQPVPTATLPPGNDWTQYRFDLAGTGVNPERNLHSGNIAQLAPAWVHDNKGSPYASTPAIVDGVIYIPSGNTLGAYNLRTGAKLWTFTGPTSSDGFFVSSSVAVDTSRHLAYYGAGNAYVYAIDTRTGVSVWRKSLGDPHQGAHIWSSPLLVHGNIYIGLASYQDKPCVRGAVVALDGASGKILWTHYTAPANETGGGVWSSVTVDVDEHAILATTGNPCMTLSGNFQPYPDYEQDAIVSIDWDSGNTNWSYQAIDADFCDCDFGEGPVSYTLAGQKYIVAGNKHGVVYSLARTASGVRLAWSAHITQNESPNHGGIFQPPSYKDGIVYISGGTLLDGSCLGAVWAIHGDTGAIAWKVCTSRRPISPGAITGDVLFVAHLGELDAYNLASGKIVWHTPIPGEIWGGVAIAHGYVVVGSVNGKLYAFNLAASG
jgi:outer membrane protein assembly factor BamB